MGSLTLASATLPRDEALPSNRESMDSDNSIVEVSLLLAQWQFAALQMAAKQRGVSTGQLLRRMIATSMGSQPPQE